MLPTQVWLGNDAASDLPGGPGAGGVDLRDDDLEVLSGVGVTQIRVGVDWARVMPSPGRVHDGWIEWYRSLATVARHHGIEVWWCLLERGLPQWFANEGGFADRRFSARWWPRWVETAADHLGDLAMGWVPIDDPSGHARRSGGDDPVRVAESLHAVAAAWRDAWRLLRGPAPVASCLRVGVVQPADQTVAALEAARELDHLMWRLWWRAWNHGVVDLPGVAGNELADLAGSLDILGLWVSAADAAGSTAARDSVLKVLERASEEGPRRPVHLTVRSGQADPDRSAEMMQAIDAAAHEAVDQGVALTQCWVAPGIAGPGAPDAVLDPGRHPLAVAEVLFQDRPR